MWFVVFGFEVGWGYMLKNVSGLGGESFYLMVKEEMGIFFF